MRSSRCKALYLIPIIVLATILYSPAVADEKANSYLHEGSDFLFSEDNQVRESPTTEQFESSVTPESLIRDNKWLNDSLTRLDYILLEMRSNLTNNLSDFGKSLINTFFEKAAPLNMSPSVTFRINYSNKTGRLIVKAALDYAGKPKAPIKDVCNMMLGTLEAQYPLKPRGYSWNNNALGILQRDFDPPDNLVYQDAVRRLAESTILVASVSSEYEVNGRNKLFVISCNKQTGGGPIAYYKSSYDMGAPPRLPTK